MLGIDDDGEQNEIAAHLAREAALQKAEIVGEKNAIIGAWAAGVDESDGHHLSGELREGDALAGLVGQGEIGDGLADAEDVGGGAGRDGLLH